MGSIHWMVEKSFLLKLCLVLFLLTHALHKATATYSLLYAFYAPSGSIPAFLIILDIGIHFSILFIGSNAFISHLSLAMYNGRDEHWLLWIMVDLYEIFALVYCGCRLACSLLASSPSFAYTNLCTWFILKRSTSCQGR
jgi:nicotinamide riboside transporter PnuC